MKRASQWVRAAPFVALAARVVLLALVVLDGVQGNGYRALFNALILAVLFVFSRVGERNSWYAPVDAVMSAFFVLAWFAPSVGIHMTSSVFGVDKVFHTAGGFLLGLAGLALYRAWVPDDAALAVSAVVFALAVGAGWEFVEWVFFTLEPSSMPTTYADSMLDLVADTLGACVAALGWLWYARRQ